MDGVTDAPVPVTSGVALGDAIEGDDVRETVGAEGDAVGVAGEAEGDGGVEKVGDEETIDKLALGDATGVREVEAVSEALSRARDGDAVGCDAVEEGDCVAAVGVASRVHVLAERLSDGCVTDAEADEDTLSLPRVGVGSDAEMVSVDVSDGGRVNVGGRDRVRLVEGETDWDRLTLGPDADADPCDSDRLPERDTDGLRAEGDRESDTVSAVPEPERVGDAVPRERVDETVPRERLSDGDRVQDEVPVAALLERERVLPDRVGVAVSVAVPRLCDAVWLNVTVAVALCDGDIVRVDVTLRVGVADTDIVPSDRLCETDCESVRVAFDGDGDAVTVSVIVALRVGEGEPEGVPAERDAVTD